VTLLRKLRCWVEEALTLPSPAKRARVRQKFFGAKTRSFSPPGERKNLTLALTAREREG